MRTKLLVLITAIFQVAFLISMCGAQEIKIDAKALSEIRFSAPESLAAKKYLGLSDVPEFRLGEIKADYIFVEIFSMYCPICQKGAPSVNQLFELVQSDPNLKNMVKFLGIGIGNTPYEVEVFQKKFNIKFPLFPDDEFRIQKISSHEIRTPTIVIARIKDQKQLEILKTKIGEIRDAQDFFKSMTSLMGYR